jgi:hypothetical protein
METVLTQILARPAERKKKSLKKRTATNSVVSLTVVTLEISLRYGTRKFIIGETYCIRNVGRSIHY